jgi:predicted outer membrane repeat protein
MSFVITVPIAEEGVISSDTRSISNRGTIQFCSNTAGIYTSSIVHPECLK